MKSPTEQEWLAAKHPYEMIYLKACRNDRKRRLLVCACARRVEHLLPDPSYLSYVELSERFADGLATDQDLRLGRSRGRKVLDRSWESLSSIEAYAARCVLCTLNKEFMSFKMAIEDAAHAIGRVNPNYGESLDDEEGPRQCILVKDIFGNPFRPSTIDSGWLTWNNRTLPKLAQTIYDDRRYDIMPILADALEEAGCSDAQILDHCRGPGPHVRGCWVVDLILGKM
jgi:hypothetical protein